MKRLLSVLLLVFAFSYLGFAADVTLDMFEYATDDSAQAAYVSSGGTVNSPVSQWKMNDNEANATVVDAVDSNNGTYKDTSGDINTSTGSVAGKINKALDFDGDEYVHIGNPANLQINTNLFVFCWIKTTGGGSIVSKANNDGGSNLGWLFDVRSKHLYPAFKSSNGTIYEGATGSIDVADGEWHHVGMSYDGSSLKSWVDGVVDNEDISATGTIRASDYNLGIGAGPDAASISYFTGQIDDVRIYNVALSLADVKAIYYAGNGIEVENPQKDLQCSSEDTIKTQGDYSLKAIAVQTDSLNDTLTRTVSPTVDLTGKDDWIFYIYSSRTGSNIKAGIHDSGGTTTESTPDVTDTGVWQKVTVDVSAVTDANKDDIDSIIITPVNADAANTFYIDYMYGAEAEEAENPTPAQVLLGGMWFKDGVLQYSDWTRFKRGAAE